MNFARIFIACFALMLGMTSAHALDSAPYTPEALAAAQKAGKPVALHFHANWCPTCRAQEKVFNEFRPDAALAITVLVADYDKERELKRKLGVRSQSTVIVYRGARETARLAGDTDPAILRAALQSAL